MENLVINPDFWNGRRVLLTGHTGFKGSWLSLWLQKLGTNLVGFSKSIPTKPSLFEVTNVNKGMTSVIGDVSDLSHLKDIILRYKPEIIIHMAAQSLVHQSYQNPVETFTTNVIGTVNLLEAVRTSGKVRVIINVTSDKCYENKELNRGYKEDDPLGGYDPYSSSKACTELVTSSYRNSFFNQTEYQKNGVALASVRAGNVIGGGDWAADRLIPDIMKGIIERHTIKIRNPEAVRPWQFVLDPLAGYLLLAERLWHHGSEYAGPWNFGPAPDDVRTVSWIVKKLAKEWKDVSWEISPNLDHETNRLMLDCTKAKTKLGWKSRMKLDQAIRWIIDWYKHYEQKDDMRKITEEQIEEFNTL